MKSLNQPWVHRGWYRDCLVIASVRVYVGHGDQSICSFSKLANLEHIVESFKNSVVTSRFLLNWLLRRIDQESKLLMNRIIFLNFKPSCLLNERHMNLTLLYVSDSDLRTCKFDIFSQHIPQDSKNYNH